MTAEVECSCPECGAEFSATPEGGHQLLCGDATVATDVERVLGGVAPHLMVTDPPYGVNYDPGWRNEAGRALDGTIQRLSSGKASVPLGARALGKVENDDRADWSEAWALFPGAVVYVWHAGTKAGIVQASLEACGFETRAQIVWAKSNFVISRGHYHAKHESCWYAVRKGETGHWAGDHKQTTVWDIPKNAKSETGHGTQKPVECMRRPIENNSAPGQAVGGVIFRRVIRVPFINRLRKQLLRVIRVANVKRKRVVNDDVALFHNSRRSRSVVSYTLSPPSDSSCSVDLDHRASSRAILLAWMPQYSPSGPRPGLFWYWWPSQWPVCRSYAHRSERYLTPGLATVAP
jgi:hypothetical protein